MATISLLGIYNLDPTIFDGLRLPSLADVDHSIEIVQDPFVPDKDDLINYLLMECRSLGLADSAPDDVKMMITTWGRVNFKKWCSLYNTMIYKYNPIWNKDGGYTDTRTRDTSGSNSGTGTTENQVTGYDTNSYSPNERDQNTYSNTGTTNERETFTHKEAGNIGVTTTQQMIREQREILEFNLYEYICRDFKQTFCIQVY